MKVIFRVIGNKEVGYGHYYRSLSLSKAMLKVDPNIEITFLINNDLKQLIRLEGFNYLVSDILFSDKDIIRKIKPNLFVIDTYLTDSAYLIEMKKYSKIMIFDDNNDIYDVNLSNIVLNGNIHAMSLDYYLQPNILALIGPRYLIMKEEYWEGFTYDSENENILITSGGTDNHGVISQILSNLQKLKVQKTVIIGPGFDVNYIKLLENMKDEKTKLIYSPKSLKEFILESSIVISAGGSTVYEIIACKRLPIIFSLANNQDLACLEFYNNNIPYIGKYPDINYDIIAQYIESNQNRKESSELLSLIDGKGALRVAVEVIKFLEGGNLNDYRREKY